MKVSGTRFRGLAPHKITPMLGVLHRSRGSGVFSNVASLAATAVMRVVILLMAMDPEHRKILNIDGKPIPRSKTVRERVAESSLRLRAAILAFVAIVAAIATFAANLNKVASLVTSDPSSPSPTKSPELPVAAVAKSGEFTISALKLDAKNCNYTLHRFKPNKAVFDGRVTIYGENVPVNLSVVGNVSRSGVLIYGNERSQRHVPLGTSYAQTQVVQDDTAANDAGPFRPGRQEFNVNADSCWYPATHDRLIKDVSLMMRFGNDVQKGWEDQIAFSVAAFGQRFRTLDEFHAAVEFNRSAFNNELFLFLPLADTTPDDVPIALDKNWSVTGRPVAPVIEVTFSNDTNKQRVIISATFDVVAAIAFKSVHESEVLKPLAIVDIPFKILPGKYEPMTFPTLKVASNDSATIAVRLVPERHDKKYEDNYGYAVIGQLTFETSGGQVHSENMIVYFEF